MTNEVIDHEERHKALVRCYRSIFGGPEGQKVLEDLQREGFFRICTIDDDAGLMQFKEGKRFMVLYIMEMASQEKEPPHDDHH